MFERFIEIGQYQRDLAKYRPLAAQLASLPPVSPPAQEEPAEEAVVPEAQPEEVVVRWRTWTYGRS